MHLGIWLFQRKFINHLELLELREVAKKVAEQLVELESPNRKVLKNAFLQLLADLARWVPLTSSDMELRDEVMGIDEEVMYSIAELCDESY